MAQEAKKAARRVGLEQAAQELLAGAEAAVAMRDPVLADRRLLLAKGKFREAYKGEEMVLQHLYTATHTATRTATHTLQHSLKILCCSVVNTQHTEHCNTHALQRTIFSTQRCGHGREPDTLQHREFQKSACA